MAVVFGDMLVEYTGTANPLTPSGTVWIAGRKFTGFSKSGVPSSINIDTGAISGTTFKTYIQMKVIIGAYDGFQSTNFDGAEGQPNTSEALSASATSGTATSISPDTNYKVKAVSNIDGSVKTETLTYAQQ